MSDRQREQHEKGKLLLPEYFTNLFPSQLRRQARSVDSCQLSWLLSRSQKILTVIVRHMQIKSDTVQSCDMVAVTATLDWKMFVFWLKTWPLEVTKKYQVKGQSHF